MKSKNWQEVNSNHVMRSCQACPEGNTTESLTPGPAPHRYHITRPALWLWPFRSGGQNQSRNLMQFVIKPTSGQTVFAFKFWFSRLNHSYTSYRPIFFNTCCISFIIYWIHTIRHNRNHLVLKDSKQISCPKKRVSNSIP